MVNIFLFMQPFCPSLPTNKHIEMYLDRQINSSREWGYIACWL